MSSIKMAKLDFLTAKTQAKGFIAAALFIIIFLTYSADGFLGVGLTSAWVIALFGTITFMIQESSGLERFYNSVPLKSKDIVAGRYISTFCLYLITFLGSVVIFTIACLIRSEIPNMADLVTGACVSLLAFSVITGIQTPFFFKMGYMKGRLFSIVPLIIIMMLFLLPTLIPSFTYPVELLAMASTYLVLISLVASVVIMYVSYRASVAAYKSRR